MIDTSSIQEVNYETFLNSFKNTLKDVFYKKNDIEKFIQKRGFPALVLRDIMAHKPLSVAIPTEFGGRGVKVKECLGLLAAASYESLPLSLTFGINIALFLEPTAKYANPAIKEGIFNRFLTQQNMGGLMITEPDYGSDAFNMQTSNQKIGDKYHIKGIKHWQGLTGMADYWIMTSRALGENGKLGRDLDFFICDVQQPNQHIVVEEYYNNIGLYPIPYGKNIIDIEVPEAYKLQPHSTGIKLIMDMLHRSRLQFPGMAMGFLERILDEAILHCKTRIVGGKSLFELDQVQNQISKIQSAFTICSAMCARSSDTSGIEEDLSGSALEANCMKAYVTDLMQQSAQTLTQLLGAKGFREESLGARGIVDSRPFQIFEGSNEMLYTQISEIILKMMNRQKVNNLFDFLKDYNLTDKATDYFKNLINFNITEFKMPQRKIIDLGRIIANIVSANQVLEMGAKGFRKDLIDECLENLKLEVVSLVSSYQHSCKTSPIVEYKDNASWLAIS